MSHENHIHFHIPARSLSGPLGCGRSALSSIALRLLTASTPKAASSARWRPLADASGLTSPFKPATPRRMSKSAAASRRSAPSASEVASWRALGRRHPLYRLIRLSWWLLALWLGTAIFIGIIRGTF